MTPASSSLRTLNAATIAAVDWSRWKNSSSLLAGSPKVMWQCASIRPGITVSPVASIRSTVDPSASAAAARVAASAPTASIRSPRTNTSVPGVGSLPSPASDGARR